ncbi:MAG: type II toxin-antitoxin system RelE/ParE family toxin [Phycisphaeraceae bacterium]
MIYRIEFSPRAEAEISDAARFIARDSPLNARRWYDGIFEAIMGLDEMPHRYAFAREKETLNIELRQLVFKSYRVIFSVKDDLVKIHRVIHTARDVLKSPDELD